jgi:hypothetical protein
MFDWNLLNFVWLLVAAFFLGFGWAAGVWLWGRLVSPRQ